MDVLTWIQHWVVMLRVMSIRRLGGWRFGALSSRSPWQLMPFIMAIFTRRARRHKSSPASATASTTSGHDARTCTAPAESNQILTQSACVATSLGIWHYWDRARTGWLSVGIMWLSGLSGHGASGCGILGQHFKHVISVWCHKLVFQLLPGLKTCHSQQIPVTHNTHLSLKHTCHSHNLLLSHTEHSFPTLFPHNTLMVCSSRDCDQIF